MINVIMRTVSTWTPAFLVCLFVIIVLNSIVNELNFLSEVYGGSWLLVAAAGLVRFDRYLEERQ